MHPEETPLWWMNLVMPTARHPLLTIRGFVAAVYDCRIEGPPPALIELPLQQSRDSALFMKIRSIHGGRKHEFLPRFSV